MDDNVSGDQSKPCRISVVSLIGTNHYNSRICLSPAPVQLDPPACTPLRSSRLHWSSCGSSDSLRGDPSPLPSLAQMMSRPLFRPGMTMPSTDPLGRHPRLMLLPPPPMKLSVMTLPCIRTLIFSLKLCFLNTLCERPGTWCLPYLLVLCELSHRASSMLLALGHMCQRG